MGAIALWLKKRAAFKQENAGGQEKKGDAPPIDLPFFHS
jgi:hypothetical protein